MTDFEGFGGGGGGGFSLPPVGVEMISIFMGNSEKMQAKWSNRTPRSKVEPPF